MNRREFCHVLGGIAIGLIPFRNTSNPPMFIKYEIDEKGFAVLKRWGTWNYKELGFAGRPEMIIPIGFKRESICCIIPKDETKATWETVDREVSRPV